MTAINDAEFQRTCNNLLYPPRRDPAPARPVRTVDDVRAEAYAISEMLKEAAETDLRKAFKQAKRGKISLEQLGRAIDTYLKDTGS
jgi:hypothetical protein